ncbi:ATP-citrate synthase subunit alpha chain protein 1 [Orobanche minor]
MLFGKRGKSGLAALKLNLAQVAEFVKDRSVEVETGASKRLGCRAIYSA